MATSLDRNLRVTDTRKVVLMVTWLDGSETSYDRTADELCGLVADLTISYAGQWLRIEIEERQ